jgi:hypothetical protein
MLFYYFEMFFLNINFVSSSAYDKIIDLFESYNRKSELFEHRISVVQVIWRKR